MNVEVAKAIGWTAVRREDNDYADGGRSVWVWTQWVDSDGVDVDQYTVDDLLTWLRERGEVWFGCRGHGPIRAVAGGDHAQLDGPQRIATHQGATLLEALEQAVLAVANT